ncbi:FecR family protein [Reichenbachiella sp. MSK19-1]|uniref:FecR family protein n=1 Tax=Reichenbachiella sp. MSK19-1 TaxID=1897631 RepID=UPI000E6C96C5|nr:FecR domain-containing protein [Reichenbachiella sp. MSK19-1]RJE72520.1 hypothetical protein BGP76_00665 [Reichenbachiella sp. MSK19-1]
MKKAFSNYFNNRADRRELQELREALLDTQIDDEELVSSMCSIEDNHPLVEFPEHISKARMKKAIASQIDRDYATNNLSNIDSRSSSVVYLAAAVVALLMVGSIAVYYSLQPSNVSTGSIAENWKTIKTERGQLRTVGLPDGSRVKLSVESSLKYATDFMSTKKREVYLTGEAFFEVERMPKRPFVVHAKGVQTQVLGTSFNVKALGGGSRLEVAVKTGKVKVSSERDKDQFYLEPNQMVTWSDVRKEKMPVDALVTFGWIDGTLLFEREPLSKVLDRLSTWYDVDFLIKGDFGDEPYSGVHRKESLETLLTGLCFAGNLTYQKQGRQIVLRRK